MDLFEYSRYVSLNCKYYVFMNVDDFSRYFFASKDNAFNSFKTIFKRVQNKKWYFICCIRSDHCREFENHVFKIFLMTLILNINFHHPRIHNNMELLRKEYDYSGNR